MGGAMNEELEQARFGIVFYAICIFSSLFFGKAHEKKSRGSANTHTHTQRHTPVLLVQKMGVSRPAKHEQKKNEFYMQMQGVNCSCVLNK